jgi:hypothetical protein
MPPFADRREKRSDVGMKRLQRLDYLLAAVPQVVSFFRVT